MTSKEISEVLAEEVCHQCGITAWELAQNGELLEVCGEEFASDIESGTRFLVPVALCPTCHKDHHLDANRQHNPCHVKARLSRDGQT